MKKPLAIVRINTIFWGIGFNIVKPFTNLTGEPTTTCEAVGPDFRPLAEKTKKDGRTFCGELPPGVKYPGFMARIPCKMNPIWCIKP